jgi:hypothetical protein
MGRADGAGVVKQRAWFNQFKTQLQLRGPSPVTPAVTQLVGSEKCSPSLCCYCYIERPLRSSYATFTFT